MRLSSLSLATVLLFSSIVFAQHTSSAPSSPPPSPAPSAAPAPAPPPAPAPAPSAPPSPAPSAAPSVAPSVNLPHTSAPSAPPSVSAPAIHVAPGAGSSTNHVSGSTSAESSSSRVAPVAHEPESQRVIPVQKVGGEDRIKPEPRIGENPPEQEREAKPQPDLRHRVCLDGPCKETTSKPEPAEADLRHRVCLNGPCTCPAGQTATNRGCVVTSEANEAVNQCPLGQVRDGGVCIGAPVECSSFSSRAEILLSELRSLREQIQDVCSRDPSGTECADLKARRDDALLRYRALQNEATPNCRTWLIEPPI